MKVILVGYPGSQKIVPASRYLTSKYLPEFDITYLNYEGGIDGWSFYLSTYLRTLEDKNIIFSLDDYLISGLVNMYRYKEAEADIGDYVVCVKLCYCSMREHYEYPVTTQYCIWDREYLIWLLDQVKTPWEFEIVGSQLFDKTVLLRSCIDYFTNSSISSRWEGVRLDGLKEEDIKYMQANGII